MLNGIHTKFLLIITRAKAHNYITFNIMLQLCSDNNVDQRHAVSFLAYHLSDGI